MFWIRSFLSNRKIATKLDDTIGQETSLNKGLLQGSSLAPILLNIFFNIFVLNIFGKLIIYADEIILVNSQADRRLLIDHINSDILRIHNWFNINQIIINEDKNSYKFQQQIQPQRLSDQIPPSTKLIRQDVNPKGTLLTDWESSAYCNPDYTF